MKKLFSNYLFNLFLIIAIGAIVMFISLSGNTEGVFEAFANIKPQYMVLCLFMVFFWQFSVGLVLTLLTRITHPRYRIRQGFINALVASFFHGITPSASGGQIAQFYVFKKQGVKAGDAGSVLWTEFIVYQTTMCILGLILIILKFPLFFNEYSNLFIFVLVGFSINAFIIFALYALARFKKVHEWITTKGIALGVKLHLIKNPEKMLETINGQLERFTYEAEHLKDHKKELFIAVILCIIRLIFYYAVPFVIFMAMGINADFDLFLNCLAMGSFVSIVSGLIPIPGASGGTEAIFVMMFSNLFAGNIVTSAMLIWRFLTYYLMMIVGSICFIYVKMMKGETA